MKRETTRSSCCRPAALARRASVGKRNGRARRRAPGSRWTMRALLWVLVLAPLALLGGYLVLVPDRKGARREH